MFFLFLLKTLRRFNSLRIYSTRKQAITRDDDDDGDDDDDDDDDEYPHSMFKSKNKKKCIPL